MIQQLVELYQQYDEKANEIREKAAPADGLFGFGNDPRNHPCHETFYEDTGKWVAEFRKTAPDAEAALEAAGFLITAPKERASEESYWMMYAAQGWCLELVDLLNAAGCAQLRDIFEELYPKRDRMPVQAKLYKSLKKGAGKA